MHSIGCVSFLNSKPLIEPLLGRADVHVEFAVPAALLALVEGGAVSAALLPIVDYQRSAVPLYLVPAGMIGCDGPTLTVRIFSQVPPHRIQVLHADTDSHTSVVLAQLVLHERFGVQAQVVPFAATEGEHRGVIGGEQEAMLLIGDKVVNACPPGHQYPFQLDLGEQWKVITGLPFVFAMWMVRRDAVAAELVAMLGDAQRRGAGMTEQLIARYAAEKQWPADLARRYFTEYLKYEVTEPARAGVAEFFRRAGEMGVLAVRREVEYAR